MKKNYVVPEMEEVLIEGPVLLTEKSGETDGTDMCMDNDCPEEDPL